MKPRNLLWLLPLLVLISSPVWWRLTADLLKPRGDFVTRGHDAPKKNTAFTMDDVHFAQSRKGKEELRLTAKRIFSGDSDNVLQLETIQAVTGGKEDWTHISSERGRYTIKEEILTLLGNVLVTGHQGFEMRTQVLHFLTRLNKMNTTSRVHLTGKDTTVTGGGMSYDFKTGVIRIGGSGRVSCKLL